MADQVRKGLFSVSRNSNSETYYHYLTVLSAVNFDMLEVIKRIVILKKYILIIMKIYLD